MKPAEVANLLNVSPRTLRGLVRDGLIGYVVTGLKDVSRLRVGSPEPDGRVVGRVLLYLTLGALAVTSALLFVAGAEKNASITRLHQQAVPVEMTVGGCRGLLGGSGSNPQDCSGSIVANSISLNGGWNFHYDESLKTNGPLGGFVAKSWQEVKYP